MVALLSAADCYHVGLVVPDIEVAAGRLTASAGYEWTQPIEYTVDIITTSGERQLPLRFMYSVQAPHIELITEVPGTPWTSGTAAAHHLGYFVDDIAAVSTQLEVAGFQLEAKPAGDLASSFAYFIDPVGVRIEIVNRALFPDWPAFLKAAATQL